MEIQKILSTLYEGYYKEDHTPQELVSSHWKAMHAKTQVRSEEGGIKTIFSEGFGDLQIKSFPYKIFSRFNIYLYFCVLKNKRSILHVYRIAKGVCRRLGVSMTINCFHQVCAAALLMRTVSRKDDFYILNIGDGYGFLSILLKEIFPKAKIVLVDLGKTLLFQVEFCNRAHPSKMHAALFSEKNSEDMDNADFIYCPAENLSLLDSLKFDLVINSDSMAEMNCATIRHYFDFIRRHTKEENNFYCCNRIEKKLIGGEITRIDEYPWKKEDRHLIDEICPWKKFFVYHRKISERGFMIGKWRVPFISYMDGDIKHRLTVLKTVEGSFKKTASSHQEV